MGEKEQSIGALWVKEGRGFMSGQIEINGEKIRIIVFQNNYKSKDSDPDYRIFKSRPKPEAGVTPVENTEIEPF